MLQQFKVQFKYEYYYVIASSCHQSHVISCQHRQITARDVQIGGNNVNHLDCMAHINQPNSFFFRPIHCYSTEKLICSLKNKSSNLNIIPVKILKSICDIISPCLTNIINKSLTTDVFPDSHKKARVTPIPKEGDKCNLSNYRPISVLPVFSKVFEKVAYTQLYDYL